MSNADLIREAEEWVRKHWPNQEPLDDGALILRLVAALRECEAALSEIERQIPPDYGGTHYEGCEKHHAWCAVAKAVRR